MQEPGRLPVHDEAVGAGSVRAAGLDVWPGRNVAVHRRQRVENMLAAGIPADRALARIEGGDVEVDGERISKPDTPAPRGTSRYVINPQ